MKKVSIPYRWFVGGYLGSGKQWLSWIHIHDVVNSIKYLIERPDSYGVFNITAPNPVTFREFSGALGKAMNRPSWTILPSFLLKLVFGEMAKEVLLASQKVLPERLIDSGCWTSMNCSRPCSVQGKRSTSVSSDSGMSLYVTARPNRMGWPGWRCLPLACLGCSRA